ncbi:MAG: phage tail assembly chaperone [Pseudomonadota bacterium]
MTKRTTDQVAFPWEEAMAFGFAHLRMAPEAFWQMTPRELAAAMGRANAGSVGAISSDLRALLNADIKQGITSHG